MGATKKYIKHNLLVTYNIITNKLQKYNESY